MPQRERRTVRYAGRVQGVGFRFTAARVAGGFDVAGHVTNLSDGSVELIAEGTPAELDAFLKAVAESMGGKIDNARASAGAAVGDFDGFGIRY